MHGNAAFLFPKDAIRKHKNEEKNVLCATTRQGHLLTVLLTFFNALLTDLKTLLKKENILYPLYSTRVKYGNDGYVVQGSRPFIQYGCYLYS